MLWPWFGHHLTDCMSCVPVLAGFNAIRQWCVCACVCGRHTCPNIPHSVDVAQFWPFSTGWPQSRDFHTNMDRGNSCNGSVPFMSTQPIGQSVIDMTNVSTAAFPLRRRGVPRWGCPPNRWMMAGGFSPASPLIPISSPAQPIHYS